ncbi:hypothetical protein KJ835_04290 [Patescibacteria group bacterium]|nr:hypothetical protein [Patescibacteria group bacterium]
MQKTCARCTQQFEITDEDLSFYDKVSPIVAGKKLPIPPPTLCPVCRQRRRLAFRNERSLYLRKCDLCAKEIVSSFSPDKPYTVYCPPCWWSDKWDSAAYGMDYDFNKPFFKQFEQLLIKTPRLSLTSDPKAVENNCSYINFAGNSKNCYMVFDSDFNEDSYYSDVLKHSKNCIDCSYTQKSEKCYQCVDCTGCYNLNYSQDCTSCSDSYFLKNCKGSQNCIMSSNLTRKQYYILNAPHTKEEYFKFLEGMELGKQSSVQKFTQKLSEHVLKYPHKYRHSLNTENCSGDYIFNAKNCHDCYNVAEAQDLKYCDSLFRANDCMDVSSFGEKIEKVYESGTVGINGFHIIFSYIIVDGNSELLYCYDARTSKNCFGCVSTLRGKYRILNKQYTQEQYEELLPKIIDHMQKTGEWGESMPIELSSYGYNETIAQEYYPLTKEQAQKIGAKWKDADEKSRYHGPKVELPDEIKDAPQDITSKILTCVSCQKNYKIIPQELDFYKKNTIPVPVNCVDCRHKARIVLRTPRHLYPSACTKCAAPIQTTYFPKRPETVYCEKCYLAEVY